MERDVACFFFGLRHEIMHVEFGHTVFQITRNMGNQIVVLQIAFLASLSHEIGYGLIAFHALV